MQESYTIDAALDHTQIKIRRRAALRHYQPLFLFGTVTLGLGVYAASQSGISAWAMGMWGVSAILYVAGAMAFRTTPKDYHEVLLTAAEVTINDVPFDIGSLSLILTDEKLVFRDANHQAEMWHAIPSLRRRMELREVLESAIEAAKERHGAGAKDVPESIRNARIKS